MMNNRLNIIIAGGKTGGHLFPGIAVAQALAEITPRVRFLFVGTDAPFESQMLEKYGFVHKSIVSKPIKGGSIPAKLFSVSLIFISLIQSMIILKTFKPGFVLGVGGFSSFAVVLAAWIMRIPTAIQEQNAIPGVTNRMLSRFTNTIFTAFKKTKGLANNTKVKYVGNPVRRTSMADKEDKKELKYYTQKKFTILVTGGSQGAGSINNAFIDAVSLMENPGQYNIIHQTGKTDEQQVQKRYRQIKVEADASAFFDTMPQIQQKADLVITRAGAGTVFELCTRELAAILVPFPHAADNHQMHNAKALENQGAAIVIKDKDLTGENLKQTIEELANDKERLKAMAKRLQSLAMPDADKKIAIHILNTMGLKA
ncbi:MAG: undecaprenyldiphospho-muramoylpentapeptide beta-N-acetylglucosaminyltransferase [Desulfobacula sp.]|nr:undecaprenyldiphospho-muramoylpentapeptide beta-N-acetylglucosaminyltransferase [Desulfobacula sp.]